MGLDSYLGKRTYIGNQYKDKKDQVSVKVPGIKQERVNTIVEQVAYWRKANQIHRWFVENVQNGKDNCKEYFVTEATLGTLLQLCFTVRNDPTKGAKLLPAQEGFFFGTYEYDQYYLEDIERTINQLSALLKEPKSTEVYEYYYQSSW